MCLTFILPRNQICTVGGSVVKGSVTFSNSMYVLQNMREFGITQWSNTLLIIISLIKDKIQDNKLVNIIKNHMFSAK